MDIKELDLKELLTKAKDEHEGVVAFGAGALLGLWFGRSRKPHGVLWWLLIGLPLGMVLLSVAVFAAMVWGTVWAVRKLWALWQSHAVKTTPAPDKATAAPDKAGHVPDVGVAAPDTAVAEQEHERADLDLAA